MSYGRETSSYGTINPVKRGSKFKNFLDKFRSESEQESYNLGSPLVNPEDAQDNKMSIKSEFDFVQKQSNNYVKSYLLWTRGLYIMSFLLLVTNMFYFIAISKIIYNIIDYHPNCQSIKYTFLYVLGFLSLGSLLIVFGSMGAYVQSKNSLLVYTLLSLAWVCTIASFGYSYITAGYDKVRDCTQGTESLTAYKYGVITVGYCTVNLLLITLMGKVWFTLTKKIRAAHLFQSYYNGGLDSLK